MSKKVAFLITDDGLTVKTAGFIGKACVVETEKILETLKEYGVEVDTVKIEPTEEMNVAIDQQTRSKTA